MKKLASLTLSLFLMPGMVFADSPKDSPKDAPKEAAPAKTAATTAATKTNAEIAAEMEELRQALQAQQEQLQMMKEELAKRDKEIEEAREAAASANSRASEASTKATEAAATSAEVKTTTTQLNSTVASMAASNAAASSAAALTTTGQQKDEEKGPLAIRYKGVTITPVGFVAAESVSRQRATEGDINTPFTGIPYPGNALAHVSENNFTGRQSRVGALVEGKISGAKLTGYVEADFLGTGVTSNNRQSNSYVLRQRQFWGRIDLDSGWAFSGGQMWSLVTETKHGIVNRQEVLPQTIDPQYTVGFNWARQYGLRVTKAFNDQFSVAASIEGSQSTIGGRGFSTLTNTSATGSLTTNNTNFFFNGPGAGGGLFNFSDTAGYTLNKTPDFIIKAAWDPSFGHFEAIGILSTFRSRIYPCAVVGTNAGNFPAPATPPGPTSVTCPQTAGTAAQYTPSAVGASNQTSTGGGFLLHGRVSAFDKKVDLSASGGYGTGIGRYASAQLADVTARYDGVLVPIKAASWLGKLEWHTTPKLDLYAYFGGEYAGRVAYDNYTSIKVTNSPAIPPCGTNPSTGVIYAPCTAPTGVTPPTFQPGYPALTTTSINTAVSGGYGNPLFSNSSCSTETSPSPTGPSGSGFPTAGSCAGDIRYIAEGTFGFWHKVYSGEKGRLQWGIQYSYLYKVGWSGTGSSGTQAAPKAVDNMVFTSFRYYLP